MLYAILINNIPMSSPFKNKEQILSLIKRADDFNETKQLIDYLEKQKQLRTPFYLTSKEFDRILKWKLRNQYGRQIKLRQLNTDRIITDITKCAFSITHSNFEYEAELKIKILTSLKGVEIPVASAILTLCYPDKYGVIDFRNWRFLFGIKKNNFTINDYKKYLYKVNQLAKGYAVTPQQIDMAIWQLDIERG